LLEVDPLQLMTLQMAIASAENVFLANADWDYLEVNFSGIWITQRFRSELAEGVFVATLGDRLEANIYNIWQQNQPQLTLI